MAFIYKLFRLIPFLGLLFIFGCSDSFAYEDEEVAAVVRGEEITIGELRFLYPDDKVLNNIEGTAKAELIVQEAKKMNLDVSEEIEETVQAMGGYPPDDVDTSAAESIRKFAKPQAKKLGMEPKEYYEKYIEKTAETSVYMNQYILEVLGDPDLDAGIEEYNELVNEFLDQLVELNSDDVEILIKP